MNASKHQTQRVVAAAALIASVLISSCAVTRVVYDERRESDGILAEVVVMESSRMMEMVIRLQEPGSPIKEGVYGVNWLPDHYEIDDCNDDSIPDLRIVSTEGEEHIFQGTERGFIDI
ncbi:MAG: hypothetical protein R6U39_05925 [Candidatus Aegiribacteria sp.]